jgi:hypothetical protein
MTSLYEQNPVHWDAMAKNGSPSLREMSKHFNRPCEMDKALKVQGLTNHWHAGRNRASRAMETLAMYWLKDNEKDNEKDNGFDFAAHAKPKPVEVSVSDDKVVLLVMTNTASAAKITKIAAMLGAEVTDV